MRIKSKYKAGYYKKGSKSKYLLVIISVTLLIGVVLTGGYLYYYMNQNETETAYAQSGSYKVYVAADLIEHGQTITAAMLVETQMNHLPEDNYYSSLDCIGQIAIVDIPKGMALMQNMYRLLEVAPGDREVECEIITLSDNLMENDYVDVRLMLPNGEDYIVLAKKGVHDLYRSEDEQEEVCYLWLSEEEILYYSAAVVDAYLYQGASLYTTKYIEPNIQEASLVTYVPSLGTIAMMKENPNLFDLAVTQLKLGERKLLENRLTDYMNLDIRERNWSVNELEEDSKEKEEVEDIVNERGYDNNTKEDNQNLGKKEEWEEEMKLEVEVSPNDKIDASAFVED